MYISPCLRLKANQDILNIIIWMTFSKGPRVHDISFCHNVIQIIARFLHVQPYLRVFIVSRAKNNHSEGPNLSMKIELILKEPEYFGDLKAVESTRSDFVLL